MLIIFGEREHIRTRDGGSFYCQSCSEWRTYAYRIRQHYFTLFYVRTGIATSRPIEYVECLTCHNRFGVSAIRCNPGMRPPRSTERHDV
jgi:hypothetical protein